MSAKNDIGAKELLAMISASVHDMKTPLTSIMGFAEAILYGRVPEEKRDHYLMVIRDEAGRLSEICGQLLDASKIESGTKEYKFCPFDICESARRVLISLERAIEKKQLDVYFDSDEDKITVMGEESSITRVLYNICENAVKFSPVGGKLSVKISVGDSMAEVQITNDGEAMDRETLLSVFEPFYRKGNSAGTGLGMYIAKSIVEAHGGSIYADSNARTGTSFTFKIHRG